MCIIKKYSVLIRTMYLKGTRMVQFAKEEIKKKILLSARREFLKHGFEKASIRTIAAGAKTAKSNVYNYFADKDALFYAVVGGSVSEIRCGLGHAAAENVGKSDASYTMESQKKYMAIVMQFVASYSEDVSLLLFGAEGSSLAGFRSEVIGKFSDILHGWLKSVLDSVPSRFFVSCVAGFYVAIIERIMVEKPSPDKAEDYMKEFLTFVYGGWRCVMSAP